MASYLVQNGFSEWKMASYLVQNEFSEWKMASYLVQNEFSEWKMAPHLVQNASSKWELHLGQGAEYICKNENQLVTLAEPHLLIALGLRTLAQ
jgi:hypothetical protein